MSSLPPMMLRYRGAAWRGHEMVEMSIKAEAFPLMFNSLPVSTLFNEFRPERA